MNMGIGMSGDWLYDIQIVPFEDMSNITSLINENGMRRRVLVNLEAHVVVHDDMCHLEHGREVLNYNVKITFIGGTNNAVIHENTNDEINFVSISDAIINTTISIVGNEIVQLQESIKL